MKIFVYGTLKRGHNLAHVLQDQQFLGEARTAPKYRLYNCGSYPALVEANPGNEIEGEIWEVDEPCLAILDDIEDVGEGLFERRPVDLCNAQLVQAYFYLEPVQDLADCGCCWSTK